MNWDKAKRIFILLLVILNCGLAALNYTQNQKNILSQTQEKAAYQVFSNNNIILQTELIQKFPPMKRLLVAAPNYSRDELKRRFFGTEETTVTMEFDRMILKSKTKILTVDKNRYTLEFITSPEKINTFHSKNAQKVAEKYLTSLENGNSDFWLGNQIDDKDGYIFQFFDMYSGQSVFCSYYTVRVTQDGITKIEGSDFIPKGFIGEKKEICSSDEALFTFMKEIRKGNNMDTVIVEKIELGYNFQDIPENTDEIKLVPCYRIYVKGNQNPYEVNAYTNELKKQTE